MLTERFVDALSYSARLHAEQVRKGSGVPYVSHLLSVAAIALEHGADEETAIAALLHDAIEDQGGAPTREEIRRRFGDAVVAIVDGCTDAETMPKPPWRERKEQYLAHLAEAPPNVRLVSAADKLHNARSILADRAKVGEQVWERFKVPKEDSLWYYGELVKIMNSRYPGVLAGELERTVTRLRE